jgi:hypothetical protein
MSAREDEPETYRTADGELYPMPAEHACEDGWLGDDPLTGRPRPCLVCRPHLRRATSGPVTG